MKKKNIKMYGDFLYCEPAMKKSKDYLTDRANISIRRAYSDLGDLLAKTFFLVENNEASLAELRNLYFMQNKLEALLDDFKSKFMR